MARIVLRAYHGVVRNGVQEILVDFRPLDPCHRIRSHSPDGFSWSYEGSGPAQAALAILYDHLANFVRLRSRDAARQAEAVHQRFKRHVVACLPATWRMDSRAVEEFRTLLFRESAGLPHDWALWRASAFERGVITAVSGTPSIRGVRP